MQFIGIFWIYENKIYGYKEAINQVKEVDMVKDIELSHYEFWDTLQIEYQEFKGIGYDIIPRGRVLLKDNSFIIYSSREIIKSEKNQNLILNFFNLSSKNFKFIIDEHYRKIIDFGFEDF